MKKTGKIGFIEFQSVSTLILPITVSWILRPLGRCRGSVVFTVIHWSTVVFDR